MLTVGSSGSNVKKAQELLNKKTILPPSEKALVADGKFGPMTANRVRLYQIQNKLNATGIIDKTTGERLGLSASEIIAQVPTSPAITPVNVPSATPMFAEPSFFEKHKKNIILVGSGLAVVLIATLFMKSQEDSAPVVKANPKRRRRK
jgi:peptidoglycan hydrolase-like protein with peptidoglycan-binding domain